MRKKVSVAMAVRNGDMFLRQQIESILPQLLDKDELVISYDQSSDCTWDIIESYSKLDSRVKCFKNIKQSGLVNNFENAIENCSGDIIFYSDQDDVWNLNKISKVLERFNDENVSVVIHDATLVNEKLEVIHPSTFAIRNGNVSLLRNLIRLSYIGCCLAFRADLKKVVIPIPTIYRSHDWWTGSICSCFGRMEMIEESLIMHRIHENNATPKKRPSLGYQVSVRWLIISNIFKRKVLK